MTSITIYSTGRLSRLSELWNHYHRSYMNLPLMYFVIWPAAQVSAVSEMFIKDKYNPQNMYTN